MNIRLLRNNFCNFILVCENYYKNTNLKCNCIYICDKINSQNSNIKEINCLITNKIKKEDSCDCKDKCMVSISEIENITKE